MTGTKNAPFYVKINLFVLTKINTLKPVLRSKFDNSLGKKFICNLDMLRGLVPSFERS